LEGVRLIACAVQPKTPVMAFDARLPLILVWSAQAEAEGADRPFQALGRVHAGHTILCRIDGAPLPGSLQRLPASVVDGSPRSSLFPGGLNAALSEARRRQLHAQAAKPAAPALVPPHVRRAFTEGVARGLAGGVAVFGVGGAAALTVDQLPETGPREIVADAQPVAPTPVLDTEDWSAPMLVAESTPPKLPQTMARREEADVPLAAPGPDELAARRAAAFVTDKPLEVWTPDSQVVAPLYSIDPVAEFDLEPFLADIPSAIEEFPQTEQADSAPAPVHSADSVAAPAL
jgi:hypothetical protein